MFRQEAAPSPEDYGGSLSLSLSSLSLSHGPLLLLSLSPRDRRESIQKSWCCRRVWSPVALACCTTLTQSIWANSRSCLHCLSASLACSLARHVENRHGHRRERERRIGQREREKESTKMERASEKHGWSGRERSTRTTERG